VKWANSSKHAGPAARDGQNRQETEAGTQLRKATAGPWALRPLINSQQVKGTLHSTNTQISKLDWESKLEAFPSIRRAADTERWEASFRPTKVAGCRSTRWLPFYTKSGPITPANKPSAKRLYNFGGAMSSPEQEAAINEGSAERLHNLLEIAVNAHHERRVEFCISPGLRFPKLAYAVHDPDHVVRLECKDPLPVTQAES
jgi:hypothetical protein